VIDPLFVDVYAGDGPKDWSAFCAAGPPWSGVVIKCSQGTYYRSRQYASERDRFMTAAGDRLGHDLFEGGYHYLDLAIDGAAQADYAVAAAGNPGPGTLWMMLDIERGGQRIKDPSRALVEDRTRAFAARYTELSGRQATLYGGELLRDVGVRDRLGCGRSAIALYGWTLPAAVIRMTGTDLAHLMLWQYVSAEGPETGPVGYPRRAPGCGRIDISAMVLPGGIPALRSGLATP
jgi:GH25 family lysozyme M1 (1,4-beta-N-acetylmuramidase)